MLAMSLFLAAGHAEKKKIDDGLGKCKPILDVIMNISKAGRTNLESVEKIFMANEKHPNCNDGIFGEGMSDIVVKSLASDFKKIVVATLSNKKLGAFVNGRINSSTDWTDLDKIANQAEFNCPPNGKEVCERLVKISRKASEEAKRSVEK